MNKVNLVTGIGCSLFATASAAATIVTIKHAKDAYDSERVRRCYRHETPNAIMEMASGLVIGGFISLGCANTLNYTVKAITAFRHLK